MGRACVWLGVGRARIVLLGFLCGYLYAHFTHVSVLGVIIMDENQKLIDEVIEEMKLQIADNDWSVIEGLLTFVPKEKLIGFLPERSASYEQETVE